MTSYTVVYSAGALKDIEELALFIASKSSDEQLSATSEGLLANATRWRLLPSGGTKRPDLRPNMRIIGFERAVTLLFRIEEAEQLVVILGTAYRGRTIAHILERNE